MYWTILMICFLGKLCNSRIIVKCCFLIHTVSTVPSTQSTWPIFLRQPAFCSARKMFYNEPSYVLIRGVTRL